MAMKRCDFCQESVARSYCQADDAFLCVVCDERVHSANKLASRHRRSPLCKSCGRALKAAAAFESPGIGLCRSCANQPNMIINRSPPDPSSRHCHHNPIPAFVETASPTNPNHVSCLKFDPGPSPSPSPSPALAPCPARPDISSVVPVLDEQDGESTSDEESVAWLFSDHTKTMDKDLGFFEESFLLSNIFTNCDQIGKERDCVVPVVAPPFPTPNQDTFANHTISCSSLDTGLVPEATTVSETSIIPRPVDAVPVFDPLDREARVLRYKEKRKNRQFAKTIRYASRKAYAEARPRIKGRFVKQPATAAAETSFTWLTQDESGFGVVPSF